MKSNVRYFPFAPGIGWKISHGKYIVPEINLDVWNRIIDGKKITVMAHGGLVESYFSLCYLEMLNYITPKSRIFWSGNDKFSSLVHLNGIAKIESLPNGIVSRYPTPLFMDKSQNIYFNCLNNYLVVKPYYGGKGYKDKNLLSKQLLRNSTLPWNIQYIPKFRNFDLPSKEFINWSRVVRLDLNRPCVCFFYDLNCSQHNVSILKWNQNQIRSLSAMLKQQGIATLMFTKNPSLFYGSGMYCIPSIQFETIIHCLIKAQAVLSNEIDFLFLAMMLCKGAKIITKPTNRMLNLKANGNFLNIQNDVFVMKDPTPLDIFKVIQNDDSR